MKSFKSFSEEMTFKVEVEGLPAMYVNGNSPGQVKNHLRKLVKQPSMIKSVKRQTTHDVKKMYRDKAQGKEVDEMTQCESKDMPSREYDYEGEMTKQQLRTIEMASKELQAMISDDQNLPEWWQNKITLAADYMQTARDYLKSDVKEEINVDYGTDKSVEIMKKMTPGETQEGNGLWANIHAKRKRGEKMRKKGEKGAPTPAAIKSAQKEDVTEKLTIGKIRRAAYKTGKALGDVQAVKKNKVARRVKNRVVGKLAAKALSGLFK